MAVEFPAWWGPDVRKLTGALKIVDVMKARFDGAIEGVLPVDWMPTDEETQQVIFEDSEAFLRIRRLDGEVDLENKRIRHRVQFAAISEDRDVSSDIVAFVQWVLYAYGDTSFVVMPDSSKVSVRFVRETQGPLIDPQQIRDSRLVPVTVELETRWPRGLPVIAQHLDL